MTSSKALTLLAIIVLLAGLASSTGASPSISAKRTVEVHQVHLTIIDELTSTSPINLTLYVPETLNKGPLTSLYVKQAGSYYEPVKQGSVQLGGVNFTAYELQVSEAPIYVFQTYLVLERGLNRTLKTPLYPVVDVEIEECNVTVIYPEYTVNAQAPPYLATSFVDGEWRSTNTTMNLPSMTLTWLNANYSLESEVDKVVCSRCVKDVYLQADGSLKVVERLTFTSLDPTRRSEVIELHLPSSLEAVDVRDDFGPYHFTPQAKPTSPGSYTLSFLNDKLVVKVRPRFTLGLNENATFTLTYHTKPSKPLKTPIPSFTNLPILHLEARFHPPPGGSITEADPLTVSDGEAEATFNHWPLPISTVRLAFTTSLTIPSYVAPLTALVIILAASTTYLLLKPARPPVPPTPTPSPQPFIAIYQQKLALLDKQQRLLRDLATGKIKLRIYERQQRAISAELSKIDSELKTQRRQLQQAQPTLIPILDELANIEGQLAQLEAERRDAIAKMRAGKLTRKTFQQELEEQATQLRKLLDTAKTTLHRISAKT